MRLQKLTLTCIELVLDQERVLVDHLLILDDLWPLDLLLEFVLSGPRKLDALGHLIAGFRRERVVARAAMLLCRLAELVGSLAFIALMLEDIVDKATHATLRVQPLHFWLSFG